MHLVWRIPRSWRNNPRYQVPEDELPLEFVPLKDFLSDHPGTWHRNASISQLTTITEFAGRHPCVVNHLGAVLFFAGEGKDDLVDTAPAKKRAVKSSGRAKPASKKPKAKQQAAQSDSEDLSTEESEEDRVAAPSSQFVHAGLPSPSGNHRKCMRVETASPNSMPTGQAQQPRPTKPVPARNPKEPRKRKRPITEGPQDFAEMIAFPSQTWQTGSDNLYTGPARGESVIPMQHGGRATTPMYPQQYNPPPAFAAQAPYPPQAAFPPHAYPPGFYQPPYGQPQWNPPPVNAAPQAWPAAPPHAPGTYSQEDFAAFMESRRGPGR